MYRGMFLRILAYSALGTLVMAADHYMKGPIGGEEPLNLALQLLISLGGAAFIFFSNLWDKPE